jgi:hypothetical protein
VTLSDGTKFETDRLAAWNRRQNWAVLKANSTKLPKLRVADANSWSVGDIASYLEIAAEGNRVIANVSIDGKNTFPTAGMRLNVSAGPTDRAVGAALLNEYGEVIGIVAGGLIPGASAVNFYGLSMSTLNTGTRSVVRSGLVVPVSLLSGLNAEAAGRPLGVLESNGEFLAPVTAARNVVSGELARSMDKKGGISYPTEGGDVFSKKDPTLHVYVLWEGREKTKWSLTMRIFDLDNRLLNKDTVEKPLKFSLNKGEQKSTTWEIGISTLPPGIYRVDVWLNDAPAWRSFFRVSE